MDRGSITSRGASLQREKKNTPSVIVVKGGEKIILRSMVFPSMPKRENVGHSNMVLALMSRRPIWSHCVMKWPLMSTRVYIGLSSRQIHQIITLLMYPAIQPLKEEQ
jgi:hypothetical protein